MDRKPVVENTEIKINKLFVLSKLFGQNTGFRSERPISDFVSSVIQ